MSHIQGKVASGDLDEPVTVSRGVLAVAIVESVWIGFGSDADVVGFYRHATVPLDIKIRQVHCADGLARRAAPAAIAVPAGLTVSDNVNVGSSESVGAEKVKVAPHDAAVRGAHYSEISQGHVRRPLVGLVLQHQS